MLRCKTVSDGLDGNAHQKNRGDWVPSAIGTMIRKARGELVEL